VISANQLAEIESLLANAGVECPPIIKGYSRKAAANLIKELRKVREKYR
jgi:hypothetical protein